MIQDDIRLPPRSRLPVDFPEMLQVLFRDRAVVRLFNKGDHVVGPGTSGEEIRVLIAGQASLVLGETDGDGLAVTSFIPGDVFGGIEFFFGVPWTSGREIVAEEPCEVMEIAASDFEQALRSDPEFAVALVKRLVRKSTLLERLILEAKLKRQALRRLISREDHLFPDYVMGQSLHRRLTDRIDELAKSDGPVLIFGERGVGKEAIAHLIFSKSPHYRGVFLLVDALGTRGRESSDESNEPDPIDEKAVANKQQRLLFGFEDRRFPGRTLETSGYYELADGGTLLIRGVDKLSSSVQIQLLEAIRTGSFSRRGGSVTLSSKVRVIATTRLFRSEVSPERHPLLWALMGRSISIPPLRTRRREIPGLINHYVRKYSGELQEKTRPVPGGTMKVLLNYPWPGNDLELADTIRQAVFAAEGKTLTPEHVKFNARKVAATGKADLLRLGPVKRMFLSPLFPAVLQSAIIPFFFVLLLFLFVGPAETASNPAALFAWAVGWPVFVVGSLFLARFWCSLCPIGALGGLPRRLYSWEKPFPQHLKNHSEFLIAGAVLFIIWLEAATDMRNSPYLLGVLLTTMLLSAMVVSVIFERHTWCQYLCGLGGIIAVFSKASMLCLRVDSSLCISQCAKNVCNSGTAQHAGCPFGQAGPKLESAGDCKLCGQCIKSCPHGAVSVNLRIPGSEIWSSRRIRTGTSVLVVAMIAGLVGEMSMRLPAYQAFGSDLPVPPVARFTLMYLLVIVLANIAVASAALASAAAFKHGFRENHSRYGMAFLPLAVTAFIAFHLSSLIGLGGRLLVLIGEMLHLAPVEAAGPYVVEPWACALQQIIVWVGLLWTVMVMYRISRSYADNAAAVILGSVPHVMLAAIMALIVNAALRAHFCS